jgi:hypothetical protein
MGMYLGSGVSYVVCNVGNQEIHGVEFSTFWKRDNECEVADADMHSWHNTAAEIAQEVDPEESRLVW